MALRIKSRWHQDSGEHSAEEIAGALAYISWRVALDKAIALHGADFVYRDDRQRLDVIYEYLIFEVQLVDRLLYEKLPETQRRDIVIGMAKGLAQHAQDNGRDILGTGHYGSEFLARLNERAAEYADFQLSDGAPSYPFYRHLGFEIQQVMGKEGENRWVIDHVMDKDGPEVFRQLKRALHDLLE